MRYKYLLPYEVWEGEDFVDLFDAFTSSEAISIACEKYPELDKDKLKAWTSFECPMPAMYDDVD